MFLVLNKIDLVRKPKLLPMIERYGQLGHFAEIVPVSAATGDNVDRLERGDHRSAAGGRAALSGGLPDRSARALLRGRDRPRAGAAVHARRDPVFERGDHRPVRGAGAGPAACCGCYCTIVVDRESQKPIVVGRGGEMIKRIGTAAREELERFFGTRVFLDLHVRVKAEWREDERVLADIGLGRAMAG